MVVRIARLGTLTFLIWALAASADAVHFANGDRLTGAVVDAEDGLVAIDVPGIGVVSVPRTLVARIEVDNENVPGDAGSPEDVEAEGASDALWEARADLGIVVATGNTQTRDANFVAGIKRAGARFDNVLGVSVNKAQASPRSGDGLVATKDQVDVDYDLRWKHGDAWYALANFEYFRDPIKNVEQRTTAGAGVGHTFWDSARGALRTDAGISQVFEDVDVAGPDGARVTSDNNPAFRWGLQYRRWLVADRLELFHNNQLLRILDADRGAVWDSDTGLRFHLNSRWLAALRLDIQHESEPAHGRKKTDSSYAVAVGVKL